MIELLNVDCMEFLRRQPDKFYDLTLCELDPDYFAAGKKRLEQHQAQPRLFDAPAPQPIQLTM